MKPMAASRRGKGMNTLPGVKGKYYWVEVGFDVWESSRPGQRGMFTDCTGTPCYYIKRRPKGA
jgi:hypothetical protein